MRRLQLGAGEADAQMELEEFGEECPHRLPIRGPGDRDDAAPPLNPAVET
jgi:hypothetical protein